MLISFVCNFNKVLFYNVLCEFIFLTFGAFFCWQKENRLESKDTITKPFVYSSTSWCVLGPLILGCLLNLGKPRVRFIFDFVFLWWH